MKVAVLGGGPAGLYFSIAIKQLISSCEVTVFESRNESVHSYGLGYTLQTLGIDLLHRIDADFYENLFVEDAKTMIHKALFKTNTNQKIFDFTEGFSVRRPTLMKYLLKKAKELDVSIVQKLLSDSCIDEIQGDFDLVIGADGVNSIVRNRFSSQFGAESYQSSLKYSWFTNETDQVREEACFYAFNAEEGAITLTSYPLTKHKQIVAIEMTNACHERGHFKDKNPEESAEYLSQLFSQNGDKFKLEAAGLPWYSFIMNATTKPIYDKYALIGDSAFAFHYSLGQGVSTAFTMAYLLANCLSKSPNITTALERYAHTIALTLQAPMHTSLNSIKWLEKMDDHFAKTAVDQHLELFRLKHQFAA